MKYCSFEAAEEKAMGEGRKVVIMFDRIPRNLHHSPSLANKEKPNA
jgi:hypothetical protein